MSDSIKPTTVREQQQIEAPASQLVLPYRFVGSLTKAAATPSVKNAERWTTSNTAPVNVTDFLHGQPGQEIKILGDGFTTVVNGAKIKTNTGANKLLLANKVYTFVKFGNIWAEHA